MKTSQHIWIAWIVFTALSCKSGKVMHHSDKDPEADVLIQSVQLHLHFFQTGTDTDSACTILLDRYIFSELPFEDLVPPEKWISEDPAIKIEFQDTIDHLSSRKSYYPHPLYRRLEYIDENGEFKNAKIRRTDEVVILRFPYHAKYNKISVTEILKNKETRKIEFKTEAL